MRPLRTLAATALLTAALVTPPARASTGCADTDLPVSLGLFAQTAHGRLCLPAGTPPDAVQLLVHGATYNRTYWDLPHRAHHYSYQRDMARRGIATFAVDAIGSGDSSRPLSTLISGSGQASVVHQVVGRLRAGVLGHSFDRVVLVGHSMGSGLAVLVAAEHHDVDGVVLTGYRHSVDVARFTRLFVEGIRPAALDPALSRRGGDPGYLTTAPGARYLFHDPGVVEPGVLAADEETKDQVPATVVPDLLPPAFLSPLSRRIDVPVLLVNGARDAIFCAGRCESAAALLDAERPFFHPRTPVEAFVLPDAGHTLGYAPNAADYRAAVHDWMKAHFGG
ncbi:alpha/beta hydrolase [Saccharothrix australiensis]|uniref:Alpha-beta hydrolase superfamily lysophospholipase n=1 Tax=Saccharothrix australiensis TaxID=2072 RepID=A0A495W1A2_9PSEU|nr:alpha/beta fold hydrolase [Saccharothrix australiensis]RKT54900.1 alpha-beta hydrolase superfamily lysophospholipase [Saccharothrix australiensis]